MPGAALAPGRMTFRRTNRFATRFTVRFRHAPSR